MPTNYYDHHDEDDDLVEIDLSEADPNYDPATDPDASEFLGFKPKPKPTPSLTSEMKRVAGKYAFHTTESLFRLPKPTWFIEDILPLADVTILHGASGCKKSFVLLDWMLCAHHGIPWHGHDIRQGNVMFVVAEGVSGTAKRIKAWASQHDVDPLKIGVQWVARPLNLYKLTDDQIGHWRSLIEYLHIEYIVIDTLHMCSYGADENSSQEMGTVFEHAKQLAGKAHLFFAHHDPKDGAKTARGSGSIRDDADVVLQLAQREPLQSVLMAEKLKDTDPFPPYEINFEIDGSGIESSLYVDNIVRGTDPVNGPKRITAVDKCCEAIVDLGLNYGKESTSAPKMKQTLEDSLYSFGKNTVEAALRRLRGSSDELVALAHNRPEDVT